MQTALQRFGPWRADVESPATQRLAMAVWASLTKAAGLWLAGVAGTTTTARSRA